MILEINNDDFFFDAINTFTNFNLYDAVWNRYVKFGLPKIEKCIDILKKDKPKLQFLTIQEANNQLKEIEPIFNFLIKNKTIMTEIYKTDKQEFFEKSLQFIYELETTIEALEDIAEPHASWKQFCLLPSNDDWNHPDNDHWDTGNY